MKEQNKITEEEFSKYLNAFAEGNIALIHGAITLVTNDGLYSERLADVPRYMKSSLIRKVLRYVAKTALQGTFEIDGLSVSCSFCEMANGDPVSLESFQEPHMKVFSGMMTAIVSSSEEPGQIVLEASSKGLKKATIVIDTYKE